MPPVEGAPSHYLAPHVTEAIAHEIAEAGGVEVFFIGRRGKDSLVHEIEPHAFGTRSAVPVLANLVQPGDVIVHNHPSGNLLPSEADLDISSRLGNMGVGSFICNNDCSRVRVVVMPQDPKPKTPVDLRLVEEMLGPASRLAEALGEYEDRPEQRRMAVAVAEALNNDGIAVVEAGTGTGKSLAYLLPSMMYALENRERVVVSTHTINLQEQILGKDLPVVRRALGRDFSAVIVKGRSNYVCKRKASMAREELREPQGLLIEDEHRRELRDLLDWADASPTGDWNELTVPPADEAWERIVSESDNCLRLRCPFYEQCFFYNSRRQAARADVLIVNHALLLSDIAVRRESGNWSTAAVLPPYKHVVLDEAHHLEEVATHHLGSTVARPALRRLFGRLARLDGRASKRRGLYIALSERLEQLRARGLVALDAPFWKMLAFELLPSIEQVRDLCESMLDEAGYSFLEIARLDRPRQREEHRVRILPRHTSHPAWEGECLGNLHALAREIGKFVEMNRQSLGGLLELGDDVLEPLRDLALEWRSIIDRLDRQRQLALSFTREDQGICRWIELAVDKRDRLVVRLCQAPVSVAQLLRENLHQRLKSEVLTSATLAVDSEFEFLFERVGVGEEKAEGGRLKAEENGTRDEGRGTKEQGRGTRDEGRERDDGVSASAGKDVEPENQEYHRPSKIEDSSDDSSSALPSSSLSSPSALPPRPLETLILGSSFDYANQVLLGVPMDLGDPRNPGFDDRLADFIQRAIATSGGRAFVLFTSWGQMKRLHERCSPFIRRLGIDCLIQGQESRDRLLQRFREDETSVLFATSSFWEGVDVRGRALELLIITKLPFAVPSEPIQEAQFERLQIDGRDPFDSLVVPRAIIRLKQGFGRLIRARTDRGVVLIADERLLRMRYGQRFLRSLPIQNVAAERADALLHRMGEFLGGRAYASEP